MFAARYDPTGSKSTSTQEKKEILLKKLKNKKNIQQNDEIIPEKDHDGDIQMENEDNEIAEETNNKRKREEIGSDSEDYSSDSSNSESESDLDSDSDSKSNSQQIQEDDSINIKNAHKSVLTRFQKVMKKQPLVNGQDEEIEEQNIEPIEVKDVAPLPQLQLPRDKQLYSQIHKNQNLDWLTKPAYYDSTTTKPFIEFKPKIEDIILKNLKNEFKIENAFSVQITLIEELLKDLKRNKLDPTPRGDYLINAATGSGKTLSYLIPIVQQLLTNGNKIKDLGLSAIIILPTKPLVQQVYSDLLKLTKGTDINIMALKSGGDLSINEENKRFKSNLIDILITTPGRLVEHLNLNSINLQNLRFLVVDEADRLLNQNFQDWCDLLMNKIENNDNNDTFNNDIDKLFKLRCIKLVLSATLTTNSEKLTHLRLFKPRLVIVNSDNQQELYQLPKSLNEKVIRITEKLSYYKPLILLNLFKWIDKFDNRYNNFGIIFTKSNESTIRLNKLLNELNKSFGLNNKIDCINSMMNNQERNKILKNFDETGGILICTDLLSRGINLTSIKFVINYDLPTSTKEYVHRIGRTARAGNSGNAITLCYGEGEFKWFKKVVYSGKQINRNNKEITDIKFVKDKTDISNEGKEKYNDNDNDNSDIFELNLSDSDKEIYEKCLKDL